MSITIRRIAATLLASGALAVSGGAILVPSIASATPVHTGCSPTYVNGTSGWCGLYPGNATDNVKDLGQVTLTGNAQLLTIQTLSVDSGAAPRTSSACLSFISSNQINHRLQDTQCTKAGGVWFTWTGPSTTINLTQYTQFYGQIFSVQVQANEHAGNGNGDAFYNGFDVLGFIGY